MASVKTIVPILLVVFAAWYLYTPLPKDISHPWTTQGIYAAYGILGLATSASERLGISTKIDATNYLFEKLCHVVYWSTGEYSGTSVLIEKDVFDGVPVVIYRPSKRPGAEANLLPGFVNYHGGGWTVASPTISHPLLKRLVEDLNLVAVTVDYRLAPHVKFPVQFEDCLTATKYFMANAKKYGVDGHRIAVGGDSAGGNLAAAISLKLRDDASFGFVPKAQVLIYPAVQAIDTNTPAYQQTFDPYFMSRVGMSWFWSMYITGSDNITMAIAAGNHVSLEFKKKMATTWMNHDDLGERFHYAPYKASSLTNGDEKLWNEIKDVVLNPYFAPMMATDLSNLPPALVYTVEHDVLRDEGIWYAKRLREAGNIAHHVHGATTFHTNMIFFHILPVVNEHVAEMIAFLKDTL